jgi:putative transposase
MSNYRRLWIEGGTFFFTVVLADRTSDLLVREIDRLRASYRDVQGRHPFRTVAICVLPDHLHAVWQLSDGDRDYANRWRLVKAGFSRGVAAARDRSPSKIHKRDKGIWQRRYWEHAIRSEDELDRLVNYTHFNPVKHGLVARVEEWRHSSFHAFVARGDLPRDWGDGVEVAMPQNRWARASRFAHPTDSADWTEVD